MMRGDDVAVVSRRNYIGHHHGHPSPRPGPSSLDLPSPDQLYQSFTITNESHTQAWHGLEALLLCLVGGRGQRPNYREVDRLVYVWRRRET